MVPPSDTSVVVSETQSSNPPLVAVDASTSKNILRTLESKFVTPCLVEDEAYALQSRKMAVLCLALMMSNALTMGLPMTVIIAVYDPNYGTFVLAGAMLFMFIFSSVVPYVYLRRTREMPQWMVDVQVWSTVPTLIAATLFMHQVSIEVVCAVVAMVAIMLRARLWGAFMGVMLSLICFSRLVSDFSSELPSLHDAFFREQLLVERIVYSLGCSLCPVAFLCLGLYTVVQQFVQKSEEADAAIRMNLAVADKLAENLKLFDTDGVGEIIAEYSDLVDEKLLRAFTSIHHNLEEFRSHIPDYVIAAAGMSCTDEQSYESTSSYDDDDEEEDDVSGGGRNGSLSLRLGKYATNAKGARCFSLESSSHTTTTGSSTYFQERGVTTPSSRSLGGSHNNPQNGSTRRVGSETIDGFNNNRNHSTTGSSNTNATTTDVATFHSVFSSSNQFNPERNTGGGGGHVSHHPVGEDTMLMMGGPVETSINLSADMDSISPHASVNGDLVLQLNGSTNGLLRSPLNGPIRSPTGLTFFNPNPPGGDSPSSQSSNISGTSATFTTTDVSTGQCRNLTPRLFLPPSTTSGGHNNHQRDNSTQENNATNMKYVSSAAAPPTKRKADHLSPFLTSKGNGINDHKSTSSHRHNNNNNNGSGKTAAVSKAATAHFAGRATTVFVRFIAPACGGGGNGSVPKGNNAVAIRVISKCVEFAAKHAKAHNGALQYMQGCGLMVSFNAASRVAAHESKACAFALALQADVEVFGPTVVMHASIVTTTVLSFFAGSRGQLLLTVLGGFMQQHTAMHQYLFLAVGTDLSCVLICQNGAAHVDLHFEIRKIGVVSAYPQYEEEDDAFAAMSSSGVSSSTTQSEKTARHNHHQQEHPAILSPPSSAAALQNTFLDTTATGTTPPPATTTMLAKREGEQQPRRLSSPFISRRRRNNNNNNNKQQHNSRSGGGVGGERYPIFQVVSKQDDKGDESGEWMYQISSQQFNDKSSPSNKISQAVDEAISGNIDSAMLLMADGMGSLVAPSSLEGSGSGGVGGSMDPVMAKAVFQRLQMCQRNGRPFCVHVCVASMW